MRLTWLLLAFIVVPLLFTLPTPALCDEGGDESAVESSKSLTLGEALALATNHHPIMGAARQNLEIFKAKMFAAKWSWVPKIQMKGYASATPGKEGDALNGSTVYDSWGPYFSYEVSGILPVYTFGKIRNLQKMAEQGLHVGEAQIQIARAQLEELVLKAYIGLQYATGLLEAVDDGKQYMVRAREYLETKRDEDDEDYDDVDMLKLKVYESELDGQRLTVERNLKVALRGLEMLTGRPPEDFLPPAKLTRYKHELKSQDYYLQLAGTHRGELLALGAAVKAQGRRVALEKSQFYPDLFVGAFFKIARAWSVEQQSSPFAYDPYNSWFAGAGLGFQWNLDIFTRIGAIDEQRAGQRKLQAQRSAVKQQIELEVYEAWLKVDEYKSLYDLDKRAYKAARGWMLAKLDLYESGFASFEDLKGGLIEFFKRKMKLEQTVYEYNLALGQLGIACGFPVAQFLGIE